LAEEENYPFFVEYSFEDSLIEQAVSQEQRQRLIQVLNTLPARQKEILYLRFHSELSYEEICSVMGISYQTARNQFHQAIKAVRQDMAVGVVVCLALCQSVLR
jgi:RNA polymerase sigma factor (sigma-70 family)